MKDVLGGKVEERGSLPIAVVAAAVADDEEVGKEVSSVKFHNTFLGEMEAHE